MKRLINCLKCMKEDNNSSARADKDNGGNGGGGGASSDDNDNDNDNDNGRPSSTTTTSASTAFNTPLPTPKDPILAEIAANDEATNNNDLPLVIKDLDDVPSLHRQAFVEAGVTETELRDHLDLLTNILRFTNKLYIELDLEPQHPTRRSEKPFESNKSISGTAASNSRNETSSQHSPAKKEGAGDEGARRGSNKMLRAHSYDATTTVKVVNVGKTGGGDNENSNSSSRKRNNNNNNNSINSNKSNEDCGGGGGGGDDDDDGNGDGSNIVEDDNHKTNSSPPPSHSTNTTKGRSTVRKSKSKRRKAHSASASMVSTTTAMATTTATATKAAAAGNEIDTTAAERRAPWRTNRNTNNNTNDQSSIHAEKKQKKRGGSGVHSLARTTTGVTKSAKEQMIQVGKAEYERTTHIDCSLLFRAVEFSGRGGFGRVFYARRKQSKNEPPLAIKKMTVDTDKRYTNACMEIGFLSKLKHPNIVEYKSAYYVQQGSESGAREEEKKNGQGKKKQKSTSTANNTTTTTTSALKRNAAELWMVMEYLEGGTLEQATLMHRFDDRQIAFVSIAVLEALQYLHAQGLAHRDIKSSNIMMTIQANVKIIDFGLCTNVAERKVRGMVGSAFWMAPEIIWRRSMTVEMDIWSFGICVLEMCHGGPPYRDSKLRAMWTTATAGVQLHAVEAAVVDKSRLKENKSNDLISFLAQCLQYQPKERATATELLSHPLLQKAAELAEMRAVLEKVFVQKSLTAAFG